MVSLPLNSLYENGSIEDLNPKKPFISFILVGRNDNYGGDFKLRLQKCINILYDQLRTHKVDSEIIFVNYNPLPEPDILNFIDWPVSNEYTRLKIITVPVNTHRLFVTENKVKDSPVLEYVAKNVGIRRSKGEYILSMNPDIFIDDKIIMNFKKCIEPNRYYRANRIDFRYESDRKENIRIHLKGHTLPFKKFSSLKLFILIIKTGLLNLVQRNSIYFAPLLRVLEVHVIYDNIELKYHCNTSGDFMLMHKDSWFKLMGFKERTFLALHTDSLMVIQAATLGLKEHVFWNPIYHQDHVRRFDMKQENEDSKIAYKTFQKEAEKMLREKSPIIYNDHNWGMGNSTMEEIIL